MAVQLILKNSSVEDKRPVANQLANGEISLNYNEAGAFLCCRDTNGAIQQVGGVKISATAPDSPVKQTQWFEPASLTLFIYDGTNWLPIAGGGGGGGGTGDITKIIGNNGIDASEIAGVVTLNVDLAGGQDGLEFKSGQLSASIASTTSLGSVKIGNGIDVTADGTISVDNDDVLQPDDVTAGDGIEVTPGVDSVEVSVKLADPSGLEFVGDALAAKLGSGLQFDSDGAIEATGGGGSGGGDFDPSDVVGKDGISVQAVAGKAEVSVDLAGGQDGLEIAAEKLKASIAAAATLGSVKIGDNIDVTGDGTISVDLDEAGLQPDEIIGGDGIDVTAGTDSVTIDVDLAGGQDGLEIKSKKLTATIATKSILGSVKIGDEISVDADGTISGNPIVPPVISQDTAPDFVEDYIWFDTGTAEAYVGYKDPSDDEYWVSLTKVGAPGTDGKDGTPVVISQDNPPPFQEDAIWFDTSSGTAYFGYIDPSGDEYWISLSKPGVDGKPGEDGDPVIISQDTAPPFQEDAIWFNTSNGEAYFGYLDPSGDGYWISLSKPGAPGADGKDGDPVVISQDTAPPFQEDAIWFDTSNGEAYFGYLDPSGDEYWISLSKPGAPGADGTDGIPVVISQDTAPPFQEDAIWFDTSNGEAYFGYLDPSGDEYWISLSKPGAPGTDGIDGIPVVISQDTAPPFQEDAIWFDTSKGEAYFGYLDPSGDEYWISLSKPGAPGTDGIDGIPVVISQDTAPPFQEDAIWFDTSTGTAYFGYLDPSGDEYWISLSKPGRPGQDGTPVIISQDTAPPIQEDTIWFDTSKGEAFFGYIDPSGDKYWVSLSKPGQDAGGASATGDYLKLGAGTFNQEVQTTGSTTFNGNVKLPSIEFENTAKLDTEGESVFLRSFGSSADIVLQANNNVELRPNSTDGYIHFNAGNGINAYRFENPSSFNSNEGRLDFTQLNTTDRNYTFPDKDGTIALTSDITRTATMSTTAPASPQNGQIWVDDTGKFHAWSEAQSVWLSS